MLAFGLLFKKSGYSTLRERLVVNIGNSVVVRVAYFSAVGNENLIGP